MTKTYAILENGQPLDGEFYDLAGLMKAIPVADYDAVIVEFDLAEIIGSMGGPMNVVTEDMTMTWWDKHGGHNETLAMIEDGRGAPELASRYYPEITAAHSDFVERAA